MKLHNLASLVVGLSVACAVEAQDVKEAKATPIKWKKTVVDRVFRSEGVAVADVNKDGKADVIVGDVWYEAPDWKMHVLRKDKHDPKVEARNWDPKGYSESFACFADDFNGDGWPDVIVIPFPGKACYWYENPRGKPVLWKEHLLTNSACNETPIYVDLLGSGKRVLVMGWRPPSPPKDKPGGEVCYFTPGKDPTQPWQRHLISGPRPDGKDQPGSHHFYHGLGAGDINGDGRQDVIIPDGWWEQPARADGEPWTWHPTKIGAQCADMFALDIDGDGKNDVISSSGHGYGLWWHQQKPGKDGPIFLTQDLFPPPPALAKEPKDYKFSKEEQALHAALNKARDGQKRSPWRTNAVLCKAARMVLTSDPTQSDKVLADYRGNVLLKIAGAKPDVLISQVMTFQSPNLEIGVAAARAADGTLVYAVFLGDRNLFALFGQSHALHLLDINGDGVKDLVTGRRWWAHGPNGDVSPADPAYVYWFQARKSRDGLVTFTPHQVDDDSGIGTQFVVQDINGDGIPDIIVSNKKGVFVFEQVRTALRKD